MRFKKFGKTYQLRIQTAEDLQDLLALDESLWVATSAPRVVFGCDQRLLELVDSDANGRIYTFELKNAIRWLLGVLADRSRLAAGTDALPLSAVRSDSEEGRALLSSAAYVLESLGEQEADAISLGQVRGIMTGIKAMPLNGDGVISPNAAPDPETAGFIADVLACEGGVQDAGGSDGITEQQLDQFMASVKGHLDWKRRGEIPHGQSATELMPLGTETASAYEVYRTHAEKVDLFFAQCRMLRFDPRAAARMEEQESRTDGPDLLELEGVRTYLEEGPLAGPTEDGMLALAEDGLNPAYRDWVAALKRHVLQPILGEDPRRLSESDWQRVKSVLAPTAAYLAEEQGAEVAGLPEEKLLLYRDGDFAQKAQELIEADRHVADVLEGVRQVERLLLYHQNLMRLANNFVSFPELYATDRRALFEMGSAVIDGRWFKFAVRVEDLAAHSAMAGTSNIFTLYLAITGAPGQEEFCVAMPATSGTKGNLSVGKRGVFFDLSGRQYDARVVKIIENPISLREALAAPFVRLWRSVLGKVESLSGKAEQRLQAQVGQTVRQAGAPRAAAGGFLSTSGGLMVSISLAVAALSSAFAFAGRSVQ